MKATLLAFLLSLAITPANAAIKSFTVNEDTASSVEIASDGNISVFGGWAGTCTGTSSTTCDSCASLTTLTGAQKECNSRSLHDDLQLEVTFTVDTAPPSGSTIIATFDSDAISIAERSTTVTTGTTLYAKINWSQICSAIAGSSTNCDVSGIAGAGALKIGVSNGSDTTTFSADKTITVAVKTFSGSLPYTPCPTNATMVDGDGFCWFEMKGGDEKAYFNTGAGLARADTNHPSGPPEVRFKYLRVYAEPQAGGDFSAINPATSVYQDFLISDMTITTSSVSGNFIDGLVNTQPYMFAIATIDQAENVFGFSDPTETHAASPHRLATPDEVYGLLDKQSCFIATAAYGHQWDPQVNILREFRNNYLLTNPVGKAFVKFYYKVSPPIADFIAKNETLKAVVRGILSPMVWMSEKLNQYKKESAKHD